MSINGQMSIQDKVFLH